MEYALFLSLLFLAAFAFYLFFGVYIIHSNPKAPLNQLFFAVCISLCLWAFGFSVANSAPHIETALLWRRVSALGWSTVYSLLLHFLLLFTADRKTRRRRQTYRLLHIPAAILAYVFSLSGTAASRYDLVQTDYGWINTGGTGGWDLFFYVYYGGYVLACMAVIRLWRQRSADQSIRRQAHLILGAIAGALFLGTMTDVVLVSNVTAPLPQMAPLVTLLPAGAICYSIQRHRLTDQSRAGPDDLILSHAARTRLYYYISLLFLAGGLLGFSSRFLPHLHGSAAHLASVLFVSGLFFTVGLGILLAQLIKNTRVKDLLILVLILLTIPVVTFQFVDDAAITIWMFPVIIMIAGLVFSTRVPLVLITATAIITEVFIWICAPAGALRNEIDHVVRLGMFVLAFWIGSFVNRTYITRLQENIYQARFQKMVSDISSDFLSADQTNIDLKINRMLGRIGRFFEVDRTYVLQIDPPHQTIARTHEWCRPGIAPGTENIGGEYRKMFPRLREQLRAHRLAHVADVSKLSAQTAPEKAWLAERGIKSLIVIPIAGREDRPGFIGLDSLTAPKQWSGRHRELLRILSNLLADGLIKARAEREIERMAYYDHLTGLPNRTLFSDRLTQAIHLAHRNQKLIGVIFMDLDSFKTVNDTMGHSGGDRMIKSVARNLEARLRKSDTVARFGGDEFLIMLNNFTRRRHIVAVTEHIMRLFEQPQNISGQEFFMTASAGVAVYPFDGGDAGTLIKNADIAMYRAKSQGKNRYALCTPVMKKEVETDLMLSHDLYHALERGELEVYYQPQVRLSTGAIIGLEALLRWHHPDVGMVPPAVFIPLAEKSGVINRIGEWVLRAACRQNRKWQDMGLPPLRIAVNLSVSQFNNPRIADIVAYILRETGLDPAYLELEVTESAAIKEAGYAQKILGKLKALGVSISIDDFGIAYSSLSRLKMLPIDRIKIDMLFIQGIEGSEKDRAITKVIISLAKSLRLKVLAEGVETATQLEFLNQRLCDDVQGYYYYKPMPAGEIEKILRGSGLNN